MNTTRIYENQKLVYFKIACGIPRFTHGGGYWRRKSENPEKTTDLSQVIENFIT
jgi:hypothetical protein